MVTIEKLKEDFKVRLTEKMLYFSGNRFYLQLFKRSHNVELHWILKTSHSMKQVAVDLIIMLETQ